MTTGTTTRGDFNSQRDILFLDGSRIEVHKLGPLVGDFEVKVERAHGDPIHAVYQVGPDGAVGARWRPPPLESTGTAGSAVFMNATPGEFYARTARDDASRQAYIRYLYDHDAHPILLADDRSIYADDLELERLRDRYRNEDRDQARARPGEIVSRMVARELELTIQRLNDRLRRETIVAQSEGTAGGNATYLKVLQEISRSQEVSSAEVEEGSPQVHSLLNELGVRARRFEEFELAPRLDAKEFDRILRQLTSDRRSLANRILVPFLRSQALRYDALESTENVIRSLLTSLNDFLIDKEATYEPRLGLRIVTPGGDRLGPTALSSGERQLTMLLCTTVLARSDSRLFIIDEPELSLGVEWL